MTAIEKTKAIKDLLANNLPALLAAYTPALDNFDEYLNKSPLRFEDKEICVYIDFEDNDTDNKRFGAIIQVQIFGEDQVQEYHSVIMPFLENNLTPDIVDMTERESIKSKIFPIDLDESTSFILYFVEFSEPLDKCDF